MFQRNDAVDALGVARGNIAGGEGDERHQHNGDGDKSEWVGGVNAIENRAHQARQSGGGQTNHHAENRESRALLQDDRKHVASLRGERLRNNVVHGFRCA